MHHLPDVRTPEDLTKILSTAAGQSRRGIKMAQDQQETEETSVMLITWLTPHEARTLAEMASARYTTTADMVRQAVKKLLRETRYHGPGHTRKQLHEMMTQSSLSIILDPDAMWDQSNLDETTKWPTDAEGNDLIDEINFAVGNDPSIPYMTATFEQDNQPPHHWRGYLSPWTEYLGELGDLPENVYPNETFTEACQALYEAYSERHRTNAG